MSLQHAAHYLASRGRGPDDTLVHMTRREVQSLQDIARAHGGSLSINPETGLVEAGFLKNLLPMIAGAGLTALTGGAAAPWMIGLGVGGIQAARTGSLEKGLMAGLGAYGGAGLMGAGQAAAGAVDHMGAQSAAAAGDATAGIKNLPITEQLKGAYAGLGTEAGRGAALNSLNGGFGAAKTAGMALAPALMDSGDQSAPPSDNERYNYSFDPGRVTDPNANYTGAATGERTYFRPSYTRLPNSKGFNEGGIAHFDEGGDTSDMPPLKQNTALLQGAAAMNNVTPFTGSVPFAQPATPPTQVGSIQPTTSNPFYMMTGASGDAYKYLMGQGTSSAPTNPVVPTRPVIRPEPTGGGGGTETGTGTGVASVNDSPITTMPVEPPDVPEPDPYDDSPDIIEDLPEPEPYDDSPDIIEDLPEPEPYDDSPDIIEDLPEPTPYDDSPVEMPEPEPYNPEPDVIEDLPEPEPYNPEPDVIEDLPEPEPYNPEPDVIEDLPEPEPYVPEPEPTPYDPEPAPVQPEPAPAPVQPEPAPYNPEPDVIEDLPEPAPYNPEPDVIEDLPEPTPYDPAPAPYEPEPVQPEPVQPEPVQPAPAPEPAPEPVREPEPYVPEPEPYNPEPDVIEDLPEPAPYNPEPDVIEDLPEPTPYDPEPEPYDDYIFGNGREQADDFGKYGLGVSEFGGKGVREIQDVDDLGYYLGAANGGLMAAHRYAMGGSTLGGYSDGGRLLRGPGDGVSDSIPATIGPKRQPARLADGEFVIPARIVSELGNGSTEAGARKLYAMMERIQATRGQTVGKNRVATNSRADRHLPI